MALSWYTLLVAAVAGERVIELVVARRHLAWSRAQGGVEVGFGHYPVMVLLHTALLIGCVVEVAALNRPFLPWLGFPMLAILVAAQALRWWCVATLIVIPGAPRIKAGPYRLFNHPNYVAVVAEGIALPLVHTAWITALAFTVLNGFLLRARISAENAALMRLS